MKEKQTSLRAEQQKELLEILATRFENNRERHPGLEWPDVLDKLESNPEKQRSLWEMEESGGEPDVIGVDNRTGQYLFADCCKESPAGRRSLCYDPEALASRKANKPRDSAVGMARRMGIELLTEKEYRALQQLGEFDVKTSSWIATPNAIRKLGGGLFCDRRYDTVFVYHNGVESYYAGRGFRGLLKV